MTNKPRALPLDCWPKADREAWEAACVPTRRFAIGGSAAKMNPATQLSHARAYGYLLDVCIHNGALNVHAPAAASVTPEAMGVFLGKLQGRAGSVTHWSYTQKILRVAKILAPNRDFAWLRELVADLQYQARPRTKHDRVVDSRRLLKVGLDLIHRGEAKGQLTDLRRARLIRDGLMIALLSLCPIRLANLHSLRLNQQIRNIDGTWWIILKADETKSGRPDERPIPALLGPHIDRWLDGWRNLFQAPGDHFWPSIKGGGLAYTYVGTLVTETTRRELGMAVNPHLFRDCAVHTVAELAGDEMGIASSLLQHIDPRVTEKHYNKGASIGAARRYQTILQKFSRD